MSRASSASPLPRAHSPQSPVPPALLVSHPPRARELRGTPCHPPAADNCDHLEEKLNDAACLFADDEQGPFRVLVVDSIIALYRQEFLGRGELAERQQRIGTVMAKLKELSEIFNLTVIITNQVTADPGGATFMQDPKKPVGGNIVAHISDTRVYLRKAKGEQRIAKIIDSPTMPEAEATFAISLGGIVDAD